MSVAQSIRRKIHRFRQPDTVGQIVRGSSSALAINGIGQGLSFVMQVVLARVMGRDMFGTYTLVMTWVLTLAVPVGLGLPLSSVRILPEYAVNKDWSHYNGAVRCFQWLTLGFGVVVAAIGTGVLLLMNARHEMSAHHGLVYVAPFIVGLWMVPLVAQSNLISQISRAMRRVALAYGPPKILQPIVVIAAAVGIRYAVKHVSAEPVMLISATSMLLAIIIQTVIYRRDLAKTSMSAPAAYDTKNWLKFTFPMLIMSGCQNIFVSVGTLVVGSMMHLRDVAIFGVANRMVLMINFVLVATNVALGPEASALYASGDIKGLQRAVSTTVKMSFYPAAILTAVLLVLGKPILLIYGHGYTQAYPTMIALSLGCLIATAAGPVLLLMNMTGFEKIALRVCLIASVCYVVACVIGIHLYGYLGAGIACATVQAAWNVWLCILAKKHIGVNASILRFGSLRKQNNVA
jgi:O-antigen/teichoic acid export membrane protein